MREKYRFRNLFIIWISIATIIIGGGTGVLYYKEIYRNANIPYITYWWLIPLIIYSVIFIVLYLKLNITLTDKYIDLSYPLKREGVSNLSYSSVEKIILKKKNGKDYLYALRDRQDNEYRIAPLTGKKRAMKIWRILSKIFKQKNITADVKKI